MVVLDGTSRREVEPRAAPLYGDEEAAEMSYTRTYEVDGRATYEPCSVCHEDTGYACSVCSDRVCPSNKCRGTHVHAHNRIEVSWPEGGLARCDCYTDDKPVTVFFAPSFMLPLPSALMYIDHPLFSFHLRGKP